MASPTPSHTSAFITDPKSFASFNRGPITTLFSPPTSCVDVLTLRQSTRSYAPLFFGHIDYPYHDMSCYPKGSLQEQELARPTSWLMFYYSPALCPHQWITATTFTGSFPGFDPLTSISIGTQTSVAVCCPSGYEYTRFGHLCASTITPGQVARYVHPDGVTRGPETTSTFASTVIVLGEGVPIWWQRSDQAMLASAAASTSSTSSSITSASSTSPPITSAPTATHNTSAMTPTSTTSVKSPNGLSTGSQIAIGIAISLVVIIGLAVFAIFWWHHRKIKRAKIGDRVASVPNTKRRRSGILRMHVGCRPEIYQHTEEYHSRYELTPPPPPIPRKSPNMGLRKLSSLAT